MVKENTAIGNSDRANDGDFDSVLAGKYYIRIRRKKDKVQTSSFHNLSFFYM